MSRRKTYEQRLAEGVLDGRGYEILDNTQRRKNVVAKVSLDPTAHISGSLPEKYVLNHLKSLQINFDFQYHFNNNYSTAYPEDVWIADFYLEDYNTYIEIYGTYWHSTGGTAENDLVKKAYWLNSGYEIFEKGISLNPSGGGKVGKVCIWWEEEVYTGVAELFSRDLPEIISHRIPGKMKELTFDPVEEWAIKKRRQDSINLKRLIPQIDPPMKDFKKLRSRVLTTNIYGKDPLRIYRSKRFS